METIENKLWKIEKFRKNYKILENDATDEEIENYLKKHHDNELKTYEELMNRYINKK